MQLRDEMQRKTKKRKTVRKRGNAKKRRWRETECRQ